jgi:hypothetical protein
MRRRIFRVASVEPLTIRIRSTERGVAQQDDPDRARGIPNSRDADDAHGASTYWRARSRC